MAAAPSLRDTLSGAFDAASESDDDVAPEADALEPVEAAEPEEKAEPAAEPEAKEEKPAAEGARARNEDGTFAKGAKKPAAPVKAKDAGAEKGKAGAGAVPPGVAPALEPAGKAPASAAAPAPAAPAATEPTLKPPASWKPQAREKWASLPKEVQEEVHRWDGAVRQGLQRAAADRQARESIERVLQPFEPMIRAEGHQPLQAVESLLRQAHLMRFGAPAAKVQFVEGLIERNGIPVDAGWVAKLIQKHRVPIEALADALEGKAPAPGQGQPAPTFDPNTIAQQVLAQVDQRLQTQQQEQQRQEMVRLQSEGEAFLSQQEFGEDVRNLMADLLEIRARQGIALTKEQAYQEALRLHPEVSKTLAEREKQKADAEAAKAKAASTQRSRAASSSVRSQPTGAAPASKPEGLRGHLEAAFDAASGG